METICPNCKSKIENQAVFCTSCGFRVSITGKEKPFFCPRCGMENQSDSKFCRSCGHSITEKPGAQRQYDYCSQLELAGLWARIASVVVDSIVLILISSIVVVVLAIAGILPALTQEMEEPDDLLYGISGLLSIFYYIYFWGKSGQTLGKKALKMKIVRTSGEDLTRGRAALRYAGYILNSFSLGLGWIWALFDPSKQGLHDKLADTLVIRWRK